ncbi:MAG: cytochrome b N-terminal domain-containing protein [Candidatus Didemnitutus sp.]|nr:cytochrome b N-terminal domain-containing protein [Candidatus Didemnitutus sp.]
MSHHHPHPDPDCEVLADVLGNAPGNGPTMPPPLPPTRLGGFLAAGEGLFTRADAWIERALPRDYNPLAQLGVLANAALLLATVSGIPLLFWYSASSHSAWSSLAELGPYSLGGIIRSVHRYSSDLAMLLILAHAVRTFFGRKFDGARWLAWASGIALIALVWFIGWTGYWLVWDVRAQWVALDSMKAVDVLPIFGEPMLRLFAADHSVPSLLFFVVFFLHMLLPLAIAGGLMLHLARLSRTKLLPDWRFSTWITVATIVAALVLPATNAAPAQMAIKPEAFTMDWWYLWPLQISARLSGGGVWLAALLTLGGLMSLPWWLGRRRERASYQATVNISRCFACTQCSQDCPFGAITMVTRTDGKPFPSQAQVDPDLCIGCGICVGSCDTQGIGLAWFDARQVTKELQDYVVGEVAKGQPPALALVCTQMDGGWDFFKLAVWRARLPGYEVRPVPTSGWVEPKVIETLIAKGARAVLIVSSVSADPYVREGDRWLPMRLAGTREPEFRPNRADPRKVAHVRYDPTRPAQLTDAAALLLKQERAPTADRPSRLTGWIVGSALTAACFALLLWVSNAPFQHPTAAQPELVLTFRAYGDWLDQTKVTAAAQENRPAHMRAASIQVNRTRAPIVIRIESDGVTHEHVIQPKGFKSDGASIGEIRVPLTPGAHHVSLSVATNPDPDAPRQTWQGEVIAERGRLLVFAFDGGNGFVREP